MLLYKFDLYLIVSSIPVGCMLAKLSHRRISWIVVWVNLQETHNSSNKENSRAYLERCPGFRVYCTLAVHCKLLSVIIITLFVLWLAMVQKSARYGSKVV